MELISEEDGTKLSSQTNEENKTTYIVESNGGDQVFYDLNEAKEYFAKLVKEKKDRLMQSIMMNN